MKIGLSARDNKGLESKVDPRFGRANYFAVVDENMEVEFIENTAADSASGAGIGAAQLIVDQRVDAVISGNFGPKAFSALNSANIELYSFSGGSIKEAVETYNDGKLEKLSSPTNNGHINLK